MISLDTTSRSLQVLLAGTVTTNQLVWLTTYTTYATTALTPGTGTGVTNNTTAVTVMPAPAASQFRQLKWLSVRNADTVDATLILRYVDGATSRDFYRVVLDPGDTLWYMDAGSFAVIDQDGRAKGTGGGGSGLPPDGTYADIVVTGSGTLWNIGAGVVGSTELAALPAASRLLGSASGGGPFSVVAITLGTGLSMSGSTINATASGSSGGTGAIQFSDGSGGFSSSSALTWSAGSSELSASDGTNGAILKAGAQPSGNFFGPGNSILLNQGSNAAEIGAGNVQVPGTTGNTFKWNAGAGAPGTGSGTPTGSFYGSTQDPYLGTPPAWVQIDIGGLTYYVPAYQ